MTYECLYAIKPNQPTTFPANQPTNQPLLCLFISLFIYFIHLLIFCFLSLFLSLFLFFFVCVCFFFSGNFILSLESIFFLSFYEAVHQIGLFFSVSVSVIIDFCIWLRCTAGNPALKIIWEFLSFLKGIIILLREHRLLLQQTTIQTCKISSAEKY